MTLRVGWTGLDRHEVLYLADAFRVEEARDQDVRVGKVICLWALACGRGAAWIRRPDHRRVGTHELERGNAEEAAQIGVEQCRKDARRIEVGTAVPVDRAVDGDQRDRVEIADDAVLPIGG